MQTLKKKYPNVDIEKLEREYQERYAFDKDFTLWSADPDCKHALDPNCWSGVSCLKCGGWFCY